MKKIKHSSLKRNVKTHKKIKKSIQTFIKNNIEKITKVNKIKRENRECNCLLLRAARKTKLSCSEMRQSLNLSVSKSGVSKTTLEKQFQ